MRTASILQEAWRNVSLGASRTLLIAIGTIVVVGLLSAFEGISVASVIRQAADFRNSGASTIVLRDPGAIDGAACDALDHVSGVVASGAQRQRSETFQPLVLPNQGISFYDVTPGMEKLLNSSPRPRAIRGLLIEHGLATALHVVPGRTIVTESGATIVSGIYTYPDDGRNPELQYAALIVDPPSGSYDECWAKFWPVDEDYAGLMQTVVQGTDSANSDFSQLNSSLGSQFDGTALFESRLSRFAALIAFFAEFTICFIIGRSRRLEYASARHVGVSKAQLAIQVALENLMSLIPVGVFLVSAAAVVAWRLGNSFSGEVLVPESAVIVAGLVGALCGGVIASLATRVGDLSRYVKER
jgi:hypothetical protein